MFWRNKAILAKIETTYGTDSVPTGAANAILATDVQLSPMEGQDVSRELDSRPYMGGQPTVAAGMFAKLSFKCELKGSGTAGTAPAFGPLLRACACAEVVSAGVSVTYNRISTAHESVSLHFNVDGTRHVLLGARGNAVLKVSAQGIPYLEFEFWGLFAQPTAVALPTVTLGTQLSLAPQVGSSANTPTFTVGGVTLILREFSLDFGNQVVPRMLIRSESIMISDIAETIDMRVEAVALATLNPFSLAAAATTQALSLIHGVGAGRICTLSVPTGQFQRPSGYQNQDGIVEWPLKMIPVPTAGNDQLTLAFT